MQAFIFYWRNGEIDVAEGKTVQQAFKSLGYSQKDFPFLERYETAKLAETHEEDTF